MSAGFIAHYRDVISGRRRGIAAATARSLLAAAAAPYELVVRTRNRRYDRGHLTAHRVGVPVVSVGNLTVGGTGKTPMVHWLARWFGARHVAAAVVSRGYRAARGAPNDEALELEERLPGIVHCQNPDRVAAARQAVERGARVVILDDAFQHRRLARDLDIVLVDALEPFGHERLLPRGLLREPLAALARADMIGLSRADAVADARRDEIREVVCRHHPQAPWMEIAHEPHGLRKADGSQEPLPWLRGKRIAAFCGIGNPHGFRHTLEQCGCHIAGFREFPDHHAYTPADRDDLVQWAARLEPLDALVCTHKDLVKIGRAFRGPQPLVAVTVEMRFVQGQSVLENALDRLLAGEGHPSTGNAAGHAC